MRSTLLTLLLFASAGTASAHSVSTSHLVVRGSGVEPITLELDLAVRDLALVIELDANADGDITWGELQASDEAIGQHAVAGVVVRGNDAECAPRAASQAIRRYADGAYVSVALVSPCTASNMAAIEIGPSLSADRSHRMTVAFDDATTAPAILTADAPAVAMQQGRGNTFATYFREGVGHILEGYDHLAFVLSLLLPVVLLGAKRRPAREAFRRAAVIVTAFTVAHSITLSLAALGAVSPAPKFVEATIAASISIAALNNLFRVVDGRIAWLAGAFGLIHGFGFAGALSELGLPAGSRLTGLVAFNLGVEFGQIAVVCVALPLLSAAARWRGYRKLVLAPASLAIAALGGMWLFARLA